MSQTKYPSKTEFTKVCKELTDQQLTFTQVGRVFGQDFWELLVYALLDSQEAARAIQGAVNRLKAGESAEPINE